jgi:Flp pilus assembly protein TadD
VLGNTERAWSLVHEALRLDPEHVRALGLKGKLLVERRQFDEAAQTLEIAARLAPQDTAILYDLGIAYQRIGQTKKSEELHRVIVGLQELQGTYDDLSFEAVDDSRDAEIRYRLGMLAAQLGDRQRARLWLQASVRLDPGNAHARAALQALGPEGG